MKKFWLYLCLFTHKLSGMFQRDYNQVWDDKLTELFEKGKLVGYQLDPFLRKGVRVFNIDILLDGEVYCIWTSNAMYAFAHNYKPVLSTTIVDGKEYPYVFDGEFRPSFKNMVKLKLVVDEIIEQNDPEDRE